MSRLETHKTKCELDAFPSAGLSEWTKRLVRIWQYRIHQSPRPSNTGTEKNQKVSVLKTLTGSFGRWWQCIWFKFRELDESAAFHVVQTQYLVSRLWPHQKSSSAERVRKVTRAARVWVSKVFCRFAWFYHKLCLQTNSAEWPFKSGNRLLFWFLLPEQTLFHVMMKYGNMQTLLLLK